MMIKKVAVATTAILMTASPLAYAAETSSNTVGMTHPSDADLKSLTDARVAMINAALQLTPDQEKYWPAVETAIRARAKNRQARWERMAELVAEFDRLPRSGSTMYGFAIGVYPTDQPTLPAADDGSG